ncbi:hypothetical protein WKU33_18500 [Oceanobacillus sp. HCA-5259]|uniref:hypothetical protein n=1 Tax=Oceanobacillus sp. HCA-5259 TaxID=3134661 RepID=UPI0030C0BCF5
MTFVKGKSDMGAHETIKTISEEERNQLKSLLLNYSKEELAIVLHHFTKCKEMK